MSLTMNMPIPADPRESYELANQVFVQITSVDGLLYALDRSGRVWRYVPAESQVQHIERAPKKSKPRYAFWTRLTDHRAASCRDDE